MQREIKFRGKRVDNNEFAYGNLFYQSYYGSKIPYIGMGVQNGSIVGFQVDPETIGQYTSLEDCWNNEMYEQDIISYNGITLLVSFHEGSFCFYDKQSERPIFMPVEIIKHFKIIGNIIDNPELLK